MDQFLSKLNWISTLWQRTNLKKGWPKDGQQRRAVPKFFSEEAESHVDAMNYPKFFYSKKNVNRFIIGILC